ncbi:universal stress protein [Wenzhouxiangella sp. XN79A]|uniref:universal stress protein n=1 Tax=Wenzhouxiangella sp. XN79A TaxID=2724193 RepID=UPI00144A4F38|nr:universal stress protein [Wenzhouxiangella sp. XN79A]NKI35040.1 universal stress protein [Wenzhouxiangella sp. XN79A]
MSRFLVGIDGSDCGERALDIAREHARAAGAELLVCYVINWSPFTFSTPQENAERHRRREEELSVARTKLLEPRVKSLIDEGIRAEGVARHGHPARTLVQLAEEHDASMIVIGRAGDTPMKTRIFGGTAAALVQSAPCPVLVVP